MSKVTEPQTTYERSADLFMASVSAISLLVITGWLFTNPDLASFSPEFVPMAPSTALIFLGLSAAWLIFRGYSSGRGIRILVRTILVGMLIIVLILALKYFTGLGPDIEQLLVPNPTLFGQVKTGRISPLTALRFFFMIPAFLLITGDRQGMRFKNAAAGLSLVVLIMSSLNILGYIYGAPPFYGSTLIPVALTTAISFFFLSLGILAIAGPACWPVRLFVGPSLKARLMRTFMPASIVIVLLQGFLSNVSTPWIINPATRVAVAALVAVLIVFLIISLIANNLSQEIERSDQARVKAESALNQSEARFRSLVESAKDAIVNIDQNGYIVFWNRASETIFGYSAEEVIGKPLAMIFPEDIRTAYQQGLHSVLAGETPLIEKTIEMIGLRKNGDKFPLALSQATWQDGGAVFFTGIFRDISELKRSEEELQFRNTILSTQQEASIDGILVVDEAAHIVLYNHRFAEMWGIPLELIEQNVDGPILAFNANAVADRQSFLEQVQYLYEHKQEISRDEIVLKNGLIFDRYSAPMIGPDDRYYGRVWYFRDITESKRADAALRASEERFRSLYENVPTGIYRTSSEGHILMANPALLKMLGYETFEELSERNLTSEGYELEFLRQEFKNRIDKDGEVRGFESAWKNKDGSFINVRESAHLVKDENNQPLYYEGTVEDISERIRAEEALRKSASSLQAVLQSTADGILAIGIENEVLYFNDRFVELWQIPQVVMASKNDSILLQYVLDQLKDPQVFLKKVQDLYKSKEESFDILDFKDGRVFERHSRPLLVEEVIRGRVWSFRDITQRIRFELVQNAIYRITQAAITSNGIDALYQSIHTILGELIPAENFFIALYDSVTGLISFPYFVDQYDETPTEPTRMVGLTGHVIRSGRSLLVTREIYDRLVQKGDVEAVGTAGEEYLRVPLKIEGRIIGVIGVKSYMQGIHFHQEDMDLLEFVSGQVAQAIGRKRLEEEIRSLSLTDELTGLNNRRGFTLLAEQEVKLAFRMKRAMLLFFGDIDNLKTINDTWGHAQGDLVLKKISAILKVNFRDSDILARFGGDEFVVLAVDSSKESAEIITNRIQATLQACKPIEGESYHLSLSLGVARYNPDAPITLDELIAQADGQMYQEKQARKRKK
jgi:diguanylate cyclase (GGDEF)-like protein/PAS domain S-box-containing protein